MRLEVRDFPGICPTASTPAPDAPGGILDERGRTHGDFHANARAYDPANPLRFPADMVRVKLIRATQGDPWHEDHWRDIIGYAEIALAIIRKERGT